MCMPKKLVSKKSVLIDMIAALEYETYKVQIAKEYQASLGTDEGQKQVNAAEHNIESNITKLKFLKELAEKE